MTKNLKSIMKKSKKQRILVTKEQKLKYSYQWNSNYNRNMSKYTTNLFKDNRALSLFARHLESGRNI